MSIDGKAFFSERMKLMGSGDVDALVEYYAADAEVVRFLGVARGRDEIRAYLIGLLGAHQGYELVSLDQFQQSGESLMWEATVNTAAGPLQVYDVLVFNEEGKILRQFPGLQGYWGSS